MKIFVCLIALIALCSAQPYGLLFDCGSSPALGLTAAQTNDACTLFGEWLILHIANEGPGINQTIFNQTVDENIVYQFGIGVCAVGRANAWTLFSQIIAPQNQEITYFNATDTYGLVTGYDPVNQKVNGTFTLFVGGLVNFNQRFDIILWRACPTNKSFLVKYTVQGVFLNNKVLLEQVLYDPYGIARAAGIDHKRYLDVLDEFGSANTAWMNELLYPFSATGVPSRPLTAYPHCINYGGGEDD